MADARNLNLNLSFSWSHLVFRLTVSRRGAGCLEGKGSCRLGNGKEGASGEVMERRSCKSAGANVVRSGEREQEVYSWSNFFFLNLRLAEAVNIQKGKLIYRIRGHTQLPTRPNTWSNRD
jgi:hypothetical protein